MELDVAGIETRARTCLRTRHAGADLHVVGRLHGGASSITLLAEVAGAPVERLVLKVAPPGLAPVRNRDVLRQARLLKALAAVEQIPVPDVAFEDAGSPPEQPPFFAMTHCSGECFEPDLDPRDGELPAASDIRGRAYAAARALAALHRTPAADLDVADEPEISLDDELGRWERALSTIPPELVGDWESAASRLRGHLPSAARAVICHGDFRLGNTLCSGAELNAVIDWEIWSLGDLRVDLAWFLLAADTEFHPSLIRDAAGMPKPAELLAEYERHLGTGVGDMSWFRALMLFKLVAVSALIIKNAEHSGDPDGWAARGRASMPKALDRLATALDAV